MVANFTFTYITEKKKVIFNSHVWYTLAFRLKNLEKSVYYTWMIIVVCQKRSKIIFHKLFLKCYDMIYISNYCLHFSCYFFFISRLLTMIYELSQMIMALRIKVLAKKLPVRVYLEVVNSIPGPKFTRKSKWHYENVIIKKNMKYPKVWTVEWEWPTHMEIE